MSRIFSLAVVGLAVGASIGVTGARGATPDVASGMGRALAEKYCTACHLVEPGASAPQKASPPPFQVVADRPETTADSLRAHLKSTHTSSIIPLSMPNPQLTEDETTKIVAYILSLHRSPAK
jgi:mono/diheme cytochrome c family protein